MIPSLPLWVLTQVVTKFLPRPYNQTSEAPRNSESCHRRNLGAQVALSSDPARHDRRRDRIRDGRFVDSGL